MQLSQPLALSLSQSKATTNHANPPRMLNTKYTKKVEYSAH